MRYTNPIDGGPTFPTFSCELQLLTSGEKTLTHRPIYHAFRGAGETVVHQSHMEWNQGDIFLLPAWHWHWHENRSEHDAILFSMTDAPTFRALGFYREEAFAE